MLPGLFLSMIHSIENDCFSQAEFLWMDIVHVSEMGGGVLPNWHCFSGMGGRVLPNWHCFSGMGWKMLLFYLFFARICGYMIFFIVRCLRSCFHIYTYTFCEVVYIFFQETIDFYASGDRWTFSRGSNEKQENGSILIIFSFLIFK